MILMMISTRHRNYVRVSLAKNAGCLPPE
ncbi:hypothetical protein ACNKHR_15780 [Shigella flexneri]